MDSWKEEEIQKEQRGLKEHAMCGSFKKPRETRSVSRDGEPEVRGARGGWSQILQAWGKFIRRLGFILHPEGEGRESENGD